jgi:alpha-glucosidase
VLSNHDVTRHVTRYGRKDSAMGRSPWQHGVPTDLELGTLRARAALLLNLALPGSCYLYQGEELGLWEVSAIPDEQRQDPFFHRSGGADVGRDGCRVPLPWRGAQPPFGFSPDGATAQPWLPQPAEWSAHTVEALTGKSDSILELYRTALRLRREEPALHGDSLLWHSKPDEDVLDFQRETLRCVVNLSGLDAPLPESTSIILASAELSQGPNTLPANTAVWLRTR